MNTKIEQLYTRLEAGKQAPDAAHQLMIVLSSIKDEAIQEGVVSDLATRFEASSKALERLVQLIAQNVGALALLGFLINGSGNTPACDKLERYLAQSKHASNVITACANHLSPSSSAMEMGCSTNIIACLTQPTYRKDNARAAADAGVLGKLASIMQRPVDENMRLQAAAAVSHIVVGSTNRAKLAAKQGVIKPLADSLLPSHTVDVRTQAAVGLYNLFLCLPTLPQDQQLVQHCISRLAAVLLQRDAELKARHRAAGALMAISNGGAAASTAVAAALATCGIPAALVTLAATGTGHEGNHHSAAMCLLSLLMNERPSQAEAFVQAGGIEVAKSFLMRHGENIREDAAGMLGSLMRADPGYMGDIGTETLLSIAVPFDEIDAYQQREAETAAEAVADKCAACGKSSGSGKDGALQQCSQCRRVWYCGRQCQKAHWKVHKPLCVSGVHPKK